MPWEPITFMCRGYNPYFAGVEPSCSMGLGVQGYELYGFRVFCVAESLLTSQA